MSECTDQVEASNPDDDRAARSTLRLLIDPVFGPFFLGKLLSNAGVWTHNIIAAIFTYQVTNSALSVGLVTSAQFLPQLFFSAASGAVADRGERKRQLIIGRFVSAAGSGGLALCIWVMGADGISTSLPMLISAVVLGMGFVIGGPAMHAMVPSLVYPSELGRAVALDSIPMIVARAGGPAAGAALGATLGPAAAFAFAAATHIAFVLLVMVVRLRRDYTPSPSSDHSVTAGFRLLWGQPILIRLLIGIAGIGLGADPAITLAPALAEQIGSGTDLAGPFASAFGAGALVAFLVLSQLANRIGLVWVHTTGLWLMAISLAVLIIPLSPAGACVAFSIGGVGMTFAMTALTTQLQEGSPEEFRGRIMALWSLAFLGSRPFASTMDGLIAEKLSVSTAMAVMALVVGATAYWCRPSRVRA